MPMVHFIVGPSQYWSHLLEMNVMKLLDISQMKLLRILRLQQMNMETIPNVFDLIELRILDLSGNDEMSGTLPLLQSFKYLRQFNIAKTKIIFEPNTFDHLSLLEIIDLSSTKHVTILPSFIGCIHLCSIIYKEHQYSGIIPETWSSLTLLKQFEISHSNLKSDFELTSLPSFLIPGISLDTKLSYILHEDKQSSCLQLIWRHTAKQLTDSTRFIGEPFPFARYNCECNNQYFNNVPRCDQYFYRSASESVSASASDTSVDSAAAPIFVPNDYDPYSDYIDMMINFRFHYPNDRSPRIKNSPKSKCSISERQGLIKLMKETNDHSFIQSIPTNIHEFNPCQTVIGIMCKGGHIIGIDWSKQKHLEQLRGDAFSHLPYLRYLNLDDIEIGFLSDSICRCTHLSALNLRGLHKVPKCITKLPLIHLIISRSSHNVNFEVNISSMKLLRTLRLVNVNSSNLKDDDFKNLTELRVLDLSYNSKLSYYPFRLLTSMKYLREINLAGTIVRFEADTFNNLLSLEKINLSDNTGDIKQWFFNSGSVIHLPSFQGCIRLSKIVFYNNYFKNKGTFPEQWKQLSELKTLKVSKDVFEIKELPSFLIEGISDDVHSRQISHCKQLIWKDTAKINEQGKFVGKLFPYLYYKC
jgi:Leucine-rich repeat (LRR) protein